MAGKNERNMQRDLKTSEFSEIPKRSSAKDIVDRTRSATSQIFEHILHDIKTLELKPGELLSIPALSERFGTSRSPVREALIRLANTGLIETFPQLGTRVSQISMTEIREVYFIRNAIEIALVEELAGSKDSTHCSILKGIVEKQRLYVGKELDREFYSLNEEFHQKIAELAGYPNVWGMMQNQKYHMDRLRHMVAPLPSRASEIIEEHTAIIDSIASGDVIAAHEAMAHHLQQAIVIQKILKKKYPDYFST